MVEAHHVLPPKRSAVRGRLGELSELLCPSCFQSDFSARGAERRVAMATATRTKAIGEREIVTVSPSHGDVTPGLVPRDTPH